MTLNSSGPISLGGSTTGQSINLEVLQTATAQVSLNDTNVRNLAQVSSGQIAMPTNFWGKKYAANSATFFMMGGGGVSGNGGNQGGGGQMVGQTGLTVSVSGTTYSIVVGGAGSASSAFGYTAIAGGNGGSWTGGNAESCSNGGYGACGGAGGYSLQNALTCSGGGGAYGGSGGTPAVFNNGGFTSWSAPAGSGGLGGSGTNGYISNPYGGGPVYGGNGGAPAYASFNYTGTTIAYGGGIGGVGCVISDGPNVNCQTGTTTGTPGANTGYGGYSGVVIIRVSNAFPQPASTGSPSVVNSGGYFWFTFTGSGTITF